LNEYEEDDQHSGQDKHGEPIVATEQKINASYQRLMDNQREFDFDDHLHTLVAENIEIVQPHYNRLLHT
jgi:hypothetical protein